jgi:GxxExxY protein
MTENEISKIIVDSAIEVHKILGGCGLLESVYEEALVCELELRNFIGLSTVYKTLHLSVFASLR